MAQGQTSMEEDSADAGMLCAKHAFPAAYASCCAQNMGSPAAEVGILRETNVSAALSARIPRLRSTRPMTSDAIGCKYRHNPSADNAEGLPGGG